MNNQIGYARLLRRVQALLIDSVIISVSLLLAIFISSKFGMQGMPSAIFAGLVIFAFEPFLVTVTGGTLGQHIVGIHVKSKKTGKNINIFSAIIRFFVKVFLGLISLITVFVTRYHQGVHDLLVGSVVTVKKPETKSYNERVKERVFEESGFTYPSTLRKVSVVLLYNLLFFIMVTLFINVSVSEQCLNLNWCTEPDQFKIFLIQTLWLISIPTSIVVCWKGLLFGCRRRAAPRKN